MIKLTPQDVVLFQGDSITDGNHGRTADPNHILGHGFACMVSSRLGLENLEAHPTFINRGESGDGILQLHARWRKDAILLKPTVINILVGINNCGLSIPYDENGHGMPADRFAEGYRALLKETKEDLPNVRIVLCEPFYLPLTPKDEADAAKQNRVRREAAQLQQVVREIAQEFGCIFVPLQAMLEEQAAKTKEGYLIWDGIHPTMIGHELITRQWIKVVDSQW